MSQNHRCAAPPINPAKKSSLFEVPCRKRARPRIGAAARSRV